MNSRIIIKVAIEMGGDWMVFWGSALELIAEVFEKKMPVSQSSSDTQKYSSIAIGSCCRVIGQSQAGWRINENAVAACSMRAAK